MQEYLPENPEDVLSLEPEELAGFVLAYLNSLTDAASTLNAGNFGRSMERQFSTEVSESLVEAFMWLVYEGFMVLRHDNVGGAAFYRITKRGRSVQKPVDFEAIRKANMLPKRLLDPDLALNVWGSYLRGVYDTAVFEAFREVEIAVREASGYDEGHYGVPMMRKAFKVSPPGPLTDTAAEKGEQEAMASLFAGAIGLYKNPTSHRRVPLNAETAAELLILASHLLRIVRDRSE